MAVDEQYRSDRNRVEVEVEYKVNWYVERRWSWVATTAKKRVPCWHRERGISRECVLYRIALAYRSAIESKDPLPNIPSGMSTAGHQSICNDLDGSLVPPGAMEGCLCFTGVFLGFDRLEKYVEDHGLRH